MNLTDLYRAVLREDFNPLTAHNYKVAAEAYEYAARRATAELGVTVRSTPDPEPYPDAGVQAYVARTARVFHVSSAHCDHPYWSPEQNQNFRIVHDLIGHGIGTLGNPIHAFDTEGEIAAYLRTERYLDSILYQDSVGLSIIRAVSFAESITQLAFLQEEGTFPEQDRTTFYVPKDRRADALGL